MIFVACKDGLGHNEAESATREDCAAGAQVLLEAARFFFFGTDEHMPRWR